MKCSLDCKLISINYRTMNGEMCLVNYIKHVFIVVYNLKGEYPENNQLFSRSVLVSAKYSEITLKQYSLMCRSADSIEI